MDIIIYQITAALIITDLSSKSLINSQVLYTYYGDNTANLSQASHPQQSPPINDQQDIVTDVVTYASLDDPNTRLIGYLAYRKAAPGANIAPKPAVMIV